MVSSLSTISISLDTSQSTCNSRVIVYFFKEQADLGIANIYTCKHLFKRVVNLFCRTLIMLFINFQSVISYFSINGSLEIVIMPGSLLIVLKVEEFIQVVNNFTHSSSSYIGTTLLEA